MHEQKESLDLGMLCRCCNCKSDTLPDMEGFTESQVKSIEELCKLCVENASLFAVNA